MLLHCRTAIVVVIWLIAIIEFIFSAKGARIEVVSISSVVGSRVSALVAIRGITSVWEVASRDILAVVPLQEVTPEIWLIILS